MEEKFSLGPGGFGWTEVPVTLGVWGETGDLCAGSPVRNDRAPTQGGVRVGTAHQVRQPYVTVWGRSLARAALASGVRS